MKLSDPRSRLGILSAIFTLALGILGRAGGATYYVPADFGTIQDAIDTTITGDSIIVEPGEYSGQGNCMLNYHGKDIVVISESGPESTIIVGTGYLYGAVFDSGETNAAVISGFTMTSAEHTGIYCRESSPTIQNMIISHTYGFYGGGIYFYESEAEMANVIVEDNYAEFQGGGVGINRSNIHIYDSEIRGNRGGWGGGVAVWRSEVEIRDSKIVDNWADWSGGGIWCVVSSTLNLENVEIRGNSTTQLDGGGIHIETGSTGNFNSVKFIGNIADRWGGGMNCQNEATNPVLQNCIFLGNEGRSEGGAIVFYDRCTGHLLNCSLTGNSTSYQDEAAGGVYCGSFSEPRIENTIIAFGTDGYGVKVEDGANPTILCCDIYGNFDGNYYGDMPDQTGINGNLSEDPQFCGVQGSGNLYLQADSPCAPANNSCGILMGAFPVGCGVTATETTNWSRIKRLFE